MDGPSIGIYTAAITSLVTMVKTLWDTGSTYLENKSLKAELAKLKESLNPGNPKGPEFSQGPIRWRIDATNRYGNWPLCGNCRTFMHISSGIPGCRTCGLQLTLPIGNLVNDRNKLLASVGETGLATPYGGTAIYQ